MASIYVGTYKKYNDGNLFGKWLNLEDYADAEEFFNACAELHKDEDDPEFMFQDYEGFPDKFYSESMNEDDLQEVYDYLNDFDDNQRAIIEEYWDEEDESADAHKIIDDYYCGENDGASYAEEFAEELGELDNVPNFIRYHIDWDGVWRDMEFDGWVETTNYIFDTNR